MQVITIPTIDEIVERIVTAWKAQGMPWETMAEPSKSRYLALFTAWAELHQREWKMVADAFGPMFEEQQRILNDADLSLAAGPALDRLGLLFDP